MSDLNKQQNTHYEQCYDLRQPDTLGVLTTTREVVLRSRSVRIDLECIQQTARKLVVPAQEKGKTISPAQVLPTPAWPTQYHFFDGTEQTVNWMLLLDALNFCFWGEKDQPRWQIAYQGEVLNGYWAEAASLRRAVKEQVPLCDAEYLSNIDRQTLASIFRGLSADGPGIPLFDERLQIVHEVGQVLLERFKGQFSHLVEQAQQSGVELALLLARHFPSFHDVAYYDNQEVRFFKRAQICVADLSGAFQGQAWGSFTDLDQLTIFADYKLPQVLRHSGILVYTPELASKVDAQTLLVAGEAEEVEIRSATIWACELLRRAIVPLVEQPVSSPEIDQLLWHLGQDATAMRPYHRVRTIYY